MLLLVACATDGRDPSFPIPEYTTAEPPYEPPRSDDPFPEEEDWIQLTSNEWLRGDFKYLRNQILEFKSKELKDKTFKWRKVKELRTPRVMSVVRADRTSIQGPVIVKNNTVVVREDEDRYLVFSREDLLGIVPGGDRWWQFWSGKLSYGLTARTGNTEQVDTTFQLKLRRRKPSSRFELDYVGNLVTANNEEIAQNQRLTTRYDRFIDQRLFVTPFSLELYRDPFQNIAVRATLQPGLGYFILNRGIDKGSADWDVSLLAGLRHTEFEGVAGDDDTATITLATQVDWDITEDLELDLRYDISFGVPETDDFNTNLNLKFALELWRDFDLEFTTIWNYVNRPRPNDDGTFPLQSDFRFVLGIAWEF